jgi:hypothetical protein
MRKDEPMARAWWIIAATAGMCACAIASAAWLLPADPSGVHLLNHGRVESHGSRLEAVLPFIAIAAFVVLLAVAVIGGASAMFRSISVTSWNLPHKGYWSAPERAAILRRMIVEDLAVLFGLVIVAVGLIAVSVALSAADRTSSLADALVLAPLVCVVAIPLYTVWMLTYRYRPRRDR